MKGSKCVRPTCSRAVTNPKDYDGLCFQHALQAGIAHHFIPWEEANRELQRLMEGGWTISKIQDDYAVNHQALRDILYHRRERFRHNTVQALRDAPTQSPYRRPVWPLRRRVRALYALGFTYPEMGRAMGEKPEAIQHLSYDRATWTSPTLDTKIRAFYDEHKNDPQRPIEGKRMQAGHPLPFDWDDIDNPLEEHQRRRYYPTHRHRKLTPLIVDRVHNLVEYHGGTTKVARMLRINHDQLKSIMRGEPETIRCKLAQKITYRHNQIPALENRKAA